VKVFATGWLSRLHKPGGNEQKYPERMKEHLAWTGGKDLVRFVPEPPDILEDLVKVDLLFGFRVRVVVAEVAVTLVLHVSRSE
jgi:hypothetical protein